MRRTTLVLAAGALLAVLMATAGGIAGATSFAACGPADEATTRGTAGDDRLIGDYPAPCHDTVYGRGGDDVIKGLRLSDKLYGGAGADTLYGNRGGDKIFGGYGEDHVYGGSGDDEIDVQDPDPDDPAGRGQRDFVDCGPGFDTVTLDGDTGDGRPDRVINCEAGGQGQS